MVRIIINLLFIICCFSCLKVHPTAATTISLSTEEWTATSLEVLRVEYDKYKKSDLHNCWNRDKDIVFDYNRKVNAIKSFPFNGSFNFYLRQLKQADNSFDSIVSINKFYHFWDEVDNPTYYITFLAFKNGRVANTFVIETFEGSQKAIKYKKKAGSTIYLDALSRKTGCDASLLIISNISNTGDVEVSKLIINPDKLLFL